MKRLPTTDLYFADACGGWIGRWWRRGPVRAVGANSFVCGETLLLIRRDDAGVMQRALRWPGRLVYLIDDDVAGAAASPGMPDDYRARLAAFDRAFHRPLIERADALVVTSPTLRQVHADHPGVTMLDPFWTGQPAGTEHHHGAGTLRLAHLGSGSHAGALAALVPAITRLLAEHRAATFTYVARRGTHPLLEALPRTLRVEPRRWPGYRRWIARQRFHLGLYPLSDTAFDRARSINKLIEHVIAGAVGVYPANWPAAARLDGAAIVAPADPAAWFELLSQAVADPARLRCLAEAARSRWPVLNDPARQRAAWRTLLGLA